MTSLTAIKKIAPLAAILIIELLFSSAVMAKSAEIHTLKTPITESGQAIGNIHPTTTFKTEKVLVSNAAIIGEVFLKWVWDSTVGWVQTEVTDALIEPMRNPPGQNIGELNHSVFWSFCSGAGYQSYYNRGDHILCGREPYNPKGEPEGDYYSYPDICNQYYGRVSNYDSSSNFCVESN
jgi:hypothetical protein